MRIRLIGQRNSLGIGQHYANFADCLRRRSSIGNLVDEVDFANAEEFDQAVATSSDQDINICFVAGNIHEFFRGTIIQWVVFETTKIPVTVLNNISQAHQVWVPSTWGKKVLLEHGLDSEQVHVVPEGVDVDKYHADFRPKLVGQPLRFLFVGKYETRKSCSELINAFAEAFDQDLGVELFVKTNYFQDDPVRMQHLQDHINQVNQPNIRAYWGYLNDQEMLALYQSADVFVFPTKGEGWGLPIIEAAAMGMPIITTAWSAQQDFLSGISDSCVFVDYDLVDVDCADYRKHYPGNNTLGQWAQPSHVSLIKSLRHARDNHKVMSNNAIVNSIQIRRQWSWTNSVDRAVQLLCQSSVL